MRNIRTKAKKIPKNLNPKKVNSRRILKSRILNRKTFSVVKKAQSHSQKNPKSKKNDKIDKSMPVFRFFSRYAWLLVIVAGLLIIIVPLIFHNPLFLKNNSLTAQNSKSAVKTAAKKNNNPIEIASALLSDRELSEPPQRIIIPSLNIDLPINEARVVNGFWELSETTASHGIGSANPGQNGNIVVFAHAREGLFLPLTNIRQEDEVIVLTKDHWYRYRVFKIKTVSPDNIEVISPTKTEQLTIFTCTGFLDGQRLIVSASPMR